VGPCDTNRFFRHDRRSAAAFGLFSSYVALFRWSARTGMIYYLPTLPATRAEAQKATYLPRKGGNPRTGTGRRVGTSSHTDMITLTHSQLLPQAQFTPSPARDVSTIEVKLLNVDES